MNRFLISHEEERFKAEAPATLIRKTLAGACRLLGLKDIEISVSFVSDDTMRELNNRYRGIDESTDVLSFVQHDSDDDCAFPGNGEGHNALGDLIISPDTLKNNSEYFSIPYAEELCRVLIHGCLHLIGEDHKTNDPKEPMLKRQEELLNTLKGRLF